MYERARVCAWMYVYIYICIAQRNKTVTFVGFLYMSDFLHRWLTATQYIAPLMANFDTSLRNESLIHYADNGEF